MNIETIPVSIEGDLFFTTNCYIVSSTPQSDCVVVIDPGDEPELIRERIGSRRLAAAIFTHGHYDHVGGAAELIGSLDTPVYVHEGDDLWVEERLDTLENGSVCSLANTNAQQHVAESSDLPSEATPKDYLLVADGMLEICDLKLFILHTPGHSPGSMCLYNTQDGVLFSGDTLFKGTCGRTDLTGGSPTSMHDSLARLATLPQKTIVYPGHGAPTTIGNEIHRGLAVY